MRMRVYVLLAATIALAATAWGQVRSGHIGYVFPAGGKQGTTIEVSVAGQALRGVTDVYISGEGVHATVTKYYQAVRNLTPEQRNELVNRLSELRDKRVAELGLQARVPLFPGETFIAQREAALAAQRVAAAAQDAAAAKAAAAAAPARGTTAPPAAGATQPTATPAPAGGATRPAFKPALAGGPAEAPPVALPDVPLFRNLDSMNLKQLMNVADEYLNPQLAGRRQMNQQLGETVLLQVTIDANAPAGDRELRLATPSSLTNPLCFQVGTLPEVRVQEPTDPLRTALLPEEPPLALPVVVNGQIMPGGIDRIHFRAKEGQRLVIETSARHLMPFLADAVPGWFQAAVTLYDPQGKEAAFADHYLFDPDPVIFYEVPRDGTYELVIHDTIYRGREDFVYRIAIGQLPFITQAFPLGSRMGASTIATVDGWNLPTKRLALDTRPGDTWIREAVLRENEVPFTAITYAVDTLPECVATGPSGDAKSAQQVTLPIIINGRISQPGDVDVFKFDGHAGDTVVADVTARRLGSPLDSLVRVTDSSSHVLGWNDDYMPADGDLRPDMGVLTHDADSYLTVKLPSDGTYYVSISDTEGHGGDAYAYRLRVSPPRPDFALLMTPSSLSMGAGGSAPLTVHVLRKDGFAGDIDLALKDAPAGFTLTGGHIPKGTDHISMTVTAGPTAAPGAVALQLEGHSLVAGQTITRDVAPADDMMQAFLWRHLVPAQEELAVVRAARGAGPGPGAAQGRGALFAAGRGRLLPEGVKGPASVKVPAGGTAQVRVDFVGVMRFTGLQLALKDPPEGVSISDVKVVPAAVQFTLKVEGKSAKPGFTSNLIIEVSAEAPAAARGQNPAPPPGRGTPRISLGVLPAIGLVVGPPDAASK